MYMFLFVCLHNFMIIVRSLCVLCFIFVMLILKILGTGSLLVCTRARMRYSVSAAAAAALCSYLGGEYQ